VSPYREPQGADLAVLAERLRRAQPSLAALDERRCAELLCRVRQTLEADVALVDALVHSTRLSPENVRWGLRTTLETLTPDVLSTMRVAARVVDFGRPQATPLCVVVLAGNVFTACLRAILTPLLFQVPVLVKASSRDDVLPRALVAALPEPFRDAAAVVSFPGHDEGSMRALLQEANVVHAYGSDDTLTALRAFTSAQTLFVPHGHGLGVGVVTLPLDEALPDAARGLALDVAAYDQRGCLSPQEIFVVGRIANARRFAEALHVRLTSIERELPRGRISKDLATASARWRQTVQALGRLWEAKTHAIGVEIDPDAPLPRGPAHRHVVIRPVADQNALHAALSRYGVHLKAIGFASHARIGELVPFLPPRRSAPRMTPFGEMQTPPFDALADGRPPWTGLLWRADV